MKFFKTTLLAAVSSLTALAFAGVPVKSAEDIRITYGPVNRDIPVASFQTFAETGQIDRSLQWYFNFLTEEQAEAAQDALNYEVNVNFVPFTRFLNSDLGNVLLETMAEILQPTSSAVDGGQALRAAFVNSSNDGGFTLVEFMDNYPNTRLVVDAELLVEYVKEAQEVADDLRAAIDTFGDVEDPVGDLELLAASFVDREKADFLMLKIVSFIEQLGDITVASGLTEIDLDSDTPPEGDVVIPKAAIWELYQNLGSLGVDVEEFIDDPFTEGSEGEGVE